MRIKTKTSQVGKDSQKVYLRIFAFHIQQTL